jgi:hypothetical protein
MRLRIAGEWLQCYICHKDEFENMVAVSIPSYDIQTGVTDGGKPNILKPFKCSNCGRYEFFGDIDKIEITQEMK